MKLQNITDVKGFFDVVNECKGTVELVTADGDVLNLKSKLCQFVSMSSIFNNEAYIKELDLKFSEPEDFQKIMSFLMYGNSATEPERLSFFCEK